MEKTRITLSTIDLLMRGLGTPEDLGNFLNSPPKPLKNFD